MRLIDPSPRSFLPSFFVPLLFRLMRHARTHARARARASETRSRIQVDRVTAIEFSWKRNSKRSSNINVFFFFLFFPFLLNSRYFTRRYTVRDDDEGMIHRGNFKRPRIRKMNFIYRHIGQFSRGLTYAQFVITCIKFRSVPARSSRNAICPLDGRIPKKSLRVTILFALQFAPFR